MAYSTKFAAGIADQLAEIDSLTTRRMFGALALYAGGTIFGMIVDETLYLGLDAPGFAALRRLGAAPLRPVRRQPDRESARYISVPLDIIDDRDELLAWVRRAIAAS